MIGSGSLGVQFISSAFSSILFDLFGPIKIGIAGSLLSAIGMLGSALSFNFVIQAHFLTYGLIYGLGQSLLLTTCFSILPHYSNRKLGLINGIMNTGGNAIIVLSSIVVGKLLDSIGIIKVFYILSAMCALLCFICLVFKQFLVCLIVHTFDQLNLPSLE